MAKTVGATVEASREAKPLRNWLEHNINPVYYSYEALTYITDFLSQ